MGSKCLVEEGPECADTGNAGQKHICVWQWLHLNVQRCWLALRPLIFRQRPFRTAASHNSGPNNACHMVSKSDLNIIIIAVELLLGIILTAATLALTWPVQIGRLKAKPVLFSWFSLGIYGTMLIVHLLMDGILQNAISLGSKGRTFSSAALWAHAATVSLQFWPLIGIYALFALRFLSTPRSAVSAVGIIAFPLTLALFLSHWIIDGTKSALREGSLASTIADSRLAWFALMAVDQILHAIFIVTAGAYCAGIMASSSQKSSDTTTPEIHLT